MKQTFVVLVLMGSLAVRAQVKSPSLPEGPYRDDWESLKTYPRVPQWLQDAKFGIYWHWGVYSVPAFGSEWYPRLMYNPESDVYRFHKATYGDPLEFGYHDLVPLWTAPNFDPNAWADLCVRAGARFAGSIAVHHDNFLLWDSQFSPWNSKNMGPHIDVVGACAKAIKSRGLKFMTTFHHAWASKYYEFAFRNAEVSVSKFPELYTEPWQGKELVSNHYQDLWLAKVFEVIQKYEPDMLYFDWGLEQLIDTPHHQRLLAGYYNWAHSHHQDVAITMQPGTIQTYTGLLDYTWRHPSLPSDIPFTSDEPISLGSWSYTKNMTLKSPQRLLTDLVDVVSKNGVFLLNISPMADGTIPPDQAQVLLVIGDWLKQFGEAIYETRPWITSGEGPTQPPQGTVFVARMKQPLQYTAHDFRYTQSKDGTVIYAIQLGRPQAHSTLSLTAFGRTARPKGLSIQAVDMLGTGTIEWTLTDQGLNLTTPLRSPHDIAVVYRITLGQRSP